MRMVATESNKNGVRGESRRRETRKGVLYFFPDSICTERWCAGFFFSLIWGFWREGEEREKVTMEARG